MNQERVAGVARERHTGNTLFYSFLGRGGEEEKDVCETLARASPAVNILFGQKSRNINIGKLY